MFYIYKYISNLDFKLITKVLTYFYIFIILYFDYKKNLNKLKFIEVIQRNNHNVNY